MLPGASRELLRPVARDAAGHTCGHNLLGAGVAGALLTRSN